MNKSRKKSHEIETDEFVLPLLLLSNGNNNTYAMHISIKLTKQKHNTLRVFTDFFFNGCTQKLQPNSLPCFCCSFVFAIVFFFITLVLSVILYCFYSNLFKSIAFIFSCLLVSSVFFFVSFYLYFQFLFTSVVFFEEDLIFGFFFQFFSFYTHKIITMTSGFRQNFVKEWMI